MQNLPYHKLFRTFLCGVPLIVFGCGGNAPNTVPDAPPPYPDSPFYDNVSGSNTYTPPPSENPRENSTLSVPENSYTPTKKTSPRKPLPKNLYSLEATGTVWVLIQDKFGNELDWMSLIAGKKVPLNHRGPLTITCSSGDSLKITDPNGKPFPVPGSRKGISIIRIP